MACVHAPARVHSMHSDLNIFGVKLAFTYVFYLFSWRNFGRGPDMECTMVHLLYKAMTANLEE